MFCVTALLCLLLLFTSSCTALAATHQASITTTHPPTSSQLTYVAIGASDTFGFGTDNPYVQNWASDLENKLGNNYKLINLGIPGITLHDALRMELPIALDAHPRLVTVWLAVNDIVDKVPVSSYTRDLNILLARLRTQDPHALIALANVPDLALLPYFHHKNSPSPQLLQAQISAYNAAIAAASSKYHALLIDLSQQNYNLKSHPDYISEDGLHPTPNGYARLADLFYSAIRRNWSGLNV